MNSPKDKIASSVAKVFDKVNITSHEQIYDILYNDILFYVRYDASYEINSEINP